MIIYAYSYQMHQILNMYSVAIEICVEYQEQWDNTYSADNFIDNVSSADTEREEVRYELAVM